MRRVLLDIYERMAGHYGPTGWWPAETPFEVAVGAILTQNTAWSNVTRAIGNLKARTLLTPRRMASCPLEELASAIVPAGCFRVKAKRLHSFCAYLLGRHHGSMRRMAGFPLDTLRAELLRISGIGPETADDILLYACGKPVFVVDAYTQRILHRHGIVDAPMKYEPLRRFFESNLPSDVPMFREFHGLLVQTGRDFCRPNPACDACPLNPLLRPGQPVWR